MKIVLLRHGKPDLKMDQRIKSSDFRNLIEAYNNSGIDDSVKPSVVAIEAVANCDFIVCSDLKRSIESAQLLQVNKIHLSDAKFKEMDLPFSTNLPFKFSPEVWIVLFRIAWLFDYAQNSESFKNEKHRAKLGAKALMNLANEFGSVAFIGHGLFNRFVAKELLANNWKGPRKPGIRHWACDTYYSS